MELLIWKICFSYTPKTRARTQWSLFEFRNEFTVVIDLYLIYLDILSFYMGFIGWSLSLSLGHKNRNWHKCDRHTSTHTHKYRNFCYFYYFGISNSVSAYVRVCVWVGVCAYLCEFWVVFFKLFFILLWFSWSLGWICFLFHFVYIFF